MKQLLLILTNIIWLMCFAVALAACKKGGSSGEPTPSPTPPSSFTPEAWFAPEPGSDVVELFENTAGWSQARSKMKSFNLYDGNLSDQCGAICKNNSLSRLLAADAFRKLKAWNIPLTLGVGSVKPGINCDATGYAHQHARYIQDVKNYGGQIAGLTMDWPLASGEFHCGQDMNTTADHVINYVNVVKAKYAAVHPGEKLKIGLWEGVPSFSGEKLKTWISTLTAKGYKPDYFILDADHRGMSFENLRAEMRIVANYCRENGIVFGVALWGNDMRSPEDYTRQVKNYANNVKSIIGTPDIVQVISWEYWVQKQNQGDVFPANLSESDPNAHTNLFNWAHGLFAIP